MSKVRWGIMSTANIGTELVIPAMQQGELCEIHAIASRNGERASEVATELGIPVSYSSYDALLTDVDVEAIYIPLPNHLHVEWAKRAIEAGKHVLCEKPLGLNAAEADDLRQFASQYPETKVMEAFMYRFHPQMDRVKKLLNDGAIGQIQTIHSEFSYYNTDPDNIRNIPEYGGGGLMDIGCYCISISRYLYEAEPRKVFGKMDIDPAMGTDFRTSGILEFDKGTATFTCGTQQAAFQHANIIGTEGRIEVEMPFTPAGDKPARIWYHYDGQSDEILTEPKNHYTLQGDLFSGAILDDTPVPTPLDDALHNMIVIDGVVDSSKTGEWIPLES
ncbi:MAG: Gfo/Idh/MocA family oxidoreductase [Candidatus Marinimicrobia bacterium]|nr:Gfo/Idh/MocA family oxidoreductase [Candidatus Neomarinimicrobiota bacterium]MCF7880476.1 Gfo/Idh/MocA family oxidoreductase [Candidatus Neomarinimicrobiota bacterium]